MAYATLNDLELRFGVDEINQLTDRDDDGDNDTNVVETALNDATSEINSYLASKYTVPITSISSNLIKTCCDIARYLMHKDASTEEAEERYNRAISWLKDIATGKALLTDASGIPIVLAGTSSGSVQSFTNDRLFSDETMKYY